MKIIFKQPKISMKHGDRHKWDRQTDKRGKASGSLESKNITHIQRHTGNW